jgi:hypothetical protein
MKILLAVVLVLLNLMGQSQASVVKPKKTPSLPNTLTVAEKK